MDLYFPPLLSLSFFERSTDNIRRQTCLFHSPKDWHFFHIHILDLNSEDTDYPYHCCLPRVYHLVLWCIVASGSVPHAELNYDISVINGLNDRPKSVRNRCVIELFVTLFVLSLCHFDISAGVGAYVIGLSQISSFFSSTTLLCRLGRFVDINGHYYIGNTCVKYHYCK